MYRVPARRRFLAVCSLIASTGCSVAPSGALSRVAVVAMHGKLSHPMTRPAEAMRQCFWEAGAVELPEMPWSSARHMATSVPAAHDEIATVIGRLRERGMDRVFIAGHSLGGNMALSYAVERGGVDGVVMLAPGHLPANAVRDEWIVPAVERARQMVAEGRGQEVGTFSDTNLGRRIDVRARAADYLSWYDPNGLAEMTATAPRLSPTIPVLMAVGLEDMAWLRNLHRTILPMLPANPRHRAVVVNAGHDGVPAAAANQVRGWIREVLS